MDQRADIANLERVVARVDLTAKAPVHRRRSHRLSASPGKNQLLRRLKAKFGNEAWAQLEKIPASWLDHHGSHTENRNRGSTERPRAGWSMLGCTDEYGALHATAIPAALLVLAEIAVLFAGIVGRYVFHSPLVWSDELAGILFLWLAMLARLRLPA